MAKKKNPDANEEIQPLKEAREVDPSNIAEGGKADMGFPIVGICAPADGLAAFEAFFSGMPA